VCVCVCKGEGGRIGGSKGQSALGGFFGSVCSSVNAANENKKRDLISLGKSIFTAQQQQRGGGGKLQNCLQSRLQASVLIT
jgi:hypothetical protein